MPPLTNTAPECPRALEGHYGRRLSSQVIQETITTRKVLRHYEFATVTTTCTRNLNVQDWSTFDHSVNPTPWRKELTK